MRLSAKPPPPRPPPPPKAIVQAAIVAAAAIDPSEEFPTPDDEDPFDTTFAERVLPLEDDFDFDPRADEPTTTEPKVDPLSLLDAQDHEAHAHSLAQPIAAQPSLDIGADEDDIDPFDTSAIAAIVAPKRTEIQYLEKELLGDRPTATGDLHHSLSDPDFDPRADTTSFTGPVAATTTTTTEVSSPPPSAVDLNRRKSSLSLNIASSASPAILAFPQKSVGFVATGATTSADYLGVSTTEAAAASGKIQKPLTPYYAGDQLPEEREPDDPFDTSHVPERKPSKVELTLLERDLLASGGGGLNRSLSDPDFDPRAVTPVPTGRGAADLLATHEEHDIKVLTPALNERRSLGAAAGVRDATDDGDAEISVDTYVDPFDTSAVSRTILPGRAELRIIEDELLPQPAADQLGVVPSVLDACSDSQELGLGGKVLTPSISFDLEPAEPVEVDPFDTSIANDLAPGQVEIKLLESELIHQ